MNESNACVNLLITVSVRNKSGKIGMKLVAFFFIVAQIWMKYQENVSLLCLTITSVCVVNKHLVDEQSHLAPLTGITQTFSFLFLLSQPFEFILLLHFNSDQ